MVVALPDKVHKLTQQAYCSLLRYSQYKLAVTVHRCLQYKASEYPVDYCTSVSDIPSRSRRHLRSATLHHLTVPHYWLSTFGRQAFFVAGLTVLNLLPDSLHDPALSSNSFRQSLKSPPLSTHSAVEMLHESALCKSIIDISGRLLQRSIATS